MLGGEGGFGELQATSVRSMRAVAGMEFFFMFTFALCRAFRVDVRSGYRSIVLLNFPREGSFKGLDGNLRWRCAL